MTDENLPTRNINPKIWQIVVIALIAIAFTAVWLLTYEYPDKDPYRIPVQEHPEWIGWLSLAIQITAFLVALFVTPLLHSSFTIGLCSAEG